MGLTTKITGMLKKKEPEQAESVPFSEIGSYIAEKISEEEEKITEKSSIFVEGISKSLKGLSEFLEMVREKEREEMFKRLDMIVRNSQKRFSDSLKNVITRVHTDVKDYKDLVQFFNETADALGQIQKLNAIHGRYLYLAFDKEMKTFTKTTREMAAYHRLLGNLLESDGKKIRKLREVSEKGIQLKEMLKEEDELEKEEMQISKEIERVEKDSERLEKQLELLKSSEEYKTLVDAEKRHEELKETLKSVEKEVHNILGPLERDFRKFKRQVELGNVAFDIKIVERYEIFTEHFFEEEEGYPYLKQIAGKMKEALEKEIIDEKGRKKEKVLDILDTIINNGLLEYQKKFFSLRGQLERGIDRTITGKIENVRKETEEKKGKLQELKTRKGNSATRRAEIFDSIKKAEAEIKEKCKEMGLQTG